MQAGYSNFSSNPVYIKTTEEKHEVCLYYNNKEFCLGSGFWKTDEETTKVKLQTEMAEALGIEESSLRCGKGSNYASCDGGGFDCIATSDGFVECNGGDGKCVTSDDIAGCVARKG